MISHKVFRAIFIGLDELGEPNEVAELSLSLQRMMHLTCAGEFVSYAETCHH